MHFWGIKHIHTVLQPPAPPISSILYLLKLKLCTHWTTPHSSPPSLQQPQPPILPSVSINLTTLSTSYKWSHPAFVLWLTYVTKHNVLKASPCCTMSEFPSLLRLNNVPLYFICEHVGCLHLLASVNNATMNINIQILFNCLLSWSAWTAVRKILGGLNSLNLFSHSFWRLEVQDQVSSWFDFWWKLCSWLTGKDGVVWDCGGCSLVSLLIRTLILLDWSPTIMTSFNLIYFFTPNITIHTNFWQGEVVVVESNIQSITLSSNLFIYT